MKKRRVPISTETEKCFVCGRDAYFLLEEGACLFREAQCEHCGAGKRNSDVARAVLRTCLGSEDGCLETRRAELAPLCLYNTQAFGALHDHLHVLPDYVCSEYMDGVPPGEFVDGVRCEDLTRLTFDDDVFDLVISEEVLEHVQDLDAALREVRRVSRPGGHFIFTVPFNEHHRTRKRAALDETGRVIELLPPVHHGDAVRPEGALVFTDFGRDLPDLLAAAQLPTEDLVFGSWHRPEEVTWISDDVSYAAYRTHYEDGTLFSAFRHNSHVFVACNGKPVTHGRAVRKKRTDWRRQLEALHRKLLRQFEENETLHGKLRELGEKYGTASAYAHALEEERERLVRHADGLRRQVELVDADRKTLTGQLEEAGTYAKSLEAARADLAAQAGELRKQLAALEADGDALRRQFVEVEAYAKSVEAERDDLAAQAGELRKQLRALEADGDALRRQFVEVEAYAKSVEAERDGLIRQIEEASSYARSLEIELGRQSATAGVDPHLLQHDAPTDPDRRDVPTGDEP